MVGIFFLSYLGVPSQYFSVNPKPNPNLLTCLFVFLSDIAPSEPLDFLQGVHIYCFFIHRKPIIIYMSLYKIQNP